MNTLIDRFIASYEKRVISFVEEVDSLGTDGIPEPHLPLWGSEYNAANIKIGIFGRDTRSWGSMVDFLDHAKKCPEASIFRKQRTFREFEFTKWTNNFGKTFWDTALRILAGIHGIEDWKSLKKRKNENVLNSFLWGNTNSVEKYKVTAKRRGVPFDVWKNVKTASERHFDSLENILQIFRPDVLFILNWSLPSAFVDIPIMWENNGDHLAHAFIPETNTNIFLTAHPSWLNKKKLYEKVISGVIDAANLV